MSTHTLAKTTIEELKQSIQAGISAWVKAGSIVVKLIDDHGKTIDEIADACGLPSGAIARFEQLGRGVLYQDLLLSDAPAVKYLIHVPVSQQREAWERGCEVIVTKGDEFDTMCILPKNMTAAQCRQVFNGSRVRSLAEQRAYLEDLKTKVAVSEMTIQKPYIVRGKTVHFQAGAKLTAADLARLLADLSE